MLGFPNIMTESRSICRDVIIMALIATFAANCLASGREVHYRPIMENVVNDQFVEYFYLGDSMPVGSTTLRFGGL
jgi:hypothetical protein